MLTTSASQPNLTPHSPLADDVFQKTILIPPRFLKNNLRSLEEVPIGLCPTWERVL